jgi:hypothetical protein
MKMEPLVVRLTPVTSQQLRRRAKDRGMALASLARELLERALDTTPEALAETVAKAIDRADRRILEDLPTRTELEKIVEATLGRILEPYLPK